MNFLLKWKRYNIWKKLFIILLTMNLLTVLWLFSLAGFSTPWKKTLPKQDETSYANFTIHSTKDNLNILINSYIKDTLKKKKLAYNVQIDKDVQLIGTMKAFGKDLKLVMNFEPLVQANGDLILRQKDVKIGLLRLPVKKVLSFLKDNYSLPDWVEVLPKQESVYVALTEMETKSKIKIKVESFDLINDDIRFQVAVPNQFNK